jgi:hypothetical protein
LNLGRRSDIIGYLEVRVMTDVLIRDMPDRVVAGLDAQASRMGISRNEYLRRRLTQIGLRDEDRRTTVADLARFAETFADLADEEVMRRAWR